MIAIIDAKCLSAFVARQRDSVRFIDEHAAAASDHCIETKLLRLELRGFIQAFVNCEAVYQIADKGYKPNN